MSAEQEINKLNMEIRKLRKENRELEDRVKALQGQARELEMLNRDAWQRVQASEQCLAMLERERN